MKLVSLIIEPMFSSRILFLFFHFLREIKIDVYVYGTNEAVLFYE